MKIKQNSLWGLIAWASAAIFYSYHQIIISAMAVLHEPLVLKYSISTTEYGLISLCYTVMYSVMQIPVGIALDHYRLRKILPPVILIFSLGCLVLSFTKSYAVVLLARLAMGFAASFSVLGTFKLAAEWFSPNYFATLTGLTVSLGYFGAIAGNTPFLKLLEYAEYEYIFFALALFGFGLTAIAFIFVDNFHPLKEKELKASQVVKELKAVSSNRLSMLLILYAMMIFTPLQVFKDSLGVMFFKSYYGYSTETAAFVMSVILIASVIAAPALGMVSDFIQKRRPVIVITPVLLLITLILIMLKLDLGFINDVLLCTILTFAFGFMTWGFLLSYTVFKETHSPHLVSIGLGLMNSVNMLGGVVSLPLITMSLDILPKWYPNITNSDLYFYAFLPLPLIILLTFPLLKYIPETNCKQVK